MANTTLFGIELPDYDADLDTWGTILNAAVNAEEARFGPVLLDSGTTTSSPSQVITVPAGYRQFELRIIELVVGTSGSSVGMQVSTDGGGSYVAGTNYVYSGPVGISNTSTIFTNRSSGGDKFVFMGPVANAVASNNWALISINTPIFTAFETSVNWTSGYLGTSGSAGYESLSNAGYVAASLSRIDRVKVLPSAGNLTMRWALYGLRGF